MSFQKAVKHEAKLRLAIAGPSGSGKTYTALAIATTLAQGKPIALVDTEHGSASKYADIFGFDVLEMEPPFHPNRFSEALQDAAQAGYGVIILDSLTHAWNGTGGLLEIVDNISRQMRNPNSFAAWKDATPIQNHLVDAIISTPIHIIATMRSKQEYVLSTDDRGKQTPKKVGMTPQQRDGFEYEFDVFAEMEIDNTMLVTKSRCPALSGGVFKKPGKDVADILRKWLLGVPVAARQSDPPPPPPSVPPTGNGNGHAEPLPDPNAELEDLGRAAQATRVRRAFDAILAKQPGQDETPDPQTLKKAKSYLGQLLVDSAQRHAVTAYLIDTDNCAMWTQAQCLALITWIGLSKVGADWVPLERAISGARAILALGLDDRAGLAIRQG